MRRELGMTIALFVMCLGLYISNPDFLGQSNSINTLRQISMLGIFAIGIGFVIITGGIDLSIGSVIGLTGVLIAKLSSSQVGGLGYSLWIGIPVALGVALLIGLGQGLLITRLKLQPFIVTLGGMLFLRGVSQTIAEGGTLSLGGSPLLRLANGGLLNVGSDALVPYPLLIFLAVIGLSTYALHFTVFGRYVYAIGGNRDAAEYSGISVKRVETSTYVISAGLGGVAGVCYASYIGQMSQQVGIAYEMYAIAAAVLGGCSLRGGEGTVLGIIIGSAVMRVIDNGINMFQLPYEDADSIRRIWRLDPNWTFIIIGAVILVAVILDQIVHMVQEKRRTRRASAGAAEAAPSLPAAAAFSAAESPAARAPERENV
ncbi:ABC transporter permease [Sorangium sp. So ce1078]|uniref:ABC transporter permease n=1 Tax=Sorangium sp. So ce1078 TaxID=3133329 RepID=UPI003F60C5CD